MHEERRNVLTEIQDPDRQIAFDYFGRDARDQDQVGYIDANTRAIFRPLVRRGTRRAGQELAADEAIMDSAGADLDLRVTQTLSYLMCEERKRDG
jgi:hypothetical protein